MADPVTLAIIFGIGSFGVAKASGASTKKALLAGGIGALAGYAGGGGFGPNPLGAGAGGYAGTPGAVKREVLQKSIIDKAGADAAASASGQGLFGSLGSKFAALPKSQQLGLGVAGATLLGSAMMPKAQGQMMPGMMGTEEDYAQAYARAREDARGLSERAQYTDQGGFVSPNIYAAKEGGLAELKKFNKGGVNYLPSKTDHDEKDMNNYVRAKGYVEDGSGNGDKDEDTMLAQLADGEFVSRADAVLGAGILAGADPKDFKQMRRVGAKFFYNQQDQLKRVYDLVT
tara:strand:- start:4044 stop:4904 length:861 start_codon:yes stop_codon:yes gene_type:complete